MEKQTVYPYERFEQKVQGKNINLIGVSHCEEFFKQNEEFFRETVKNNDALIFEVGRYSFPDYNDFFGMIGRLSKQDKKPVYLLDPNNICLGGVDLLVGIGGINYGIVNFISALKDRKKIGRRKFLKKMLVTGLGLYAASGTIPGNLFRDLVYESKENPDFITLGNCDYRNIVIAENLERLSSLTENKDYAFFIGKFHLNPVNFYLKNPGWRNKRKLYYPADLICDSKIHEYQTEDNQWILKRSF
jgi:hypothetical protein